jgi:transcriptional regulator with XRE-family HTH domain
MVLVKGHGTDADKEFREALQKRLDNLPFPKYRIAMDLGISQGQLSGILNNTRAASLGLMEKIAKSFISSVADMLLEGRTLLNENITEENQLTGPQKNAIEAFKECILAGGEAAEMLARNAIDLAKRKKAEEIQKPFTTKTILKSA